MATSAKKQDRPEIFVHNPYTNRVINIEPLFYYINEFCALPDMENQEISFSESIEQVIKRISRECTISEIGDLAISDMYNTLWYARDIFKEMNELNN